MDKGIRKSIDTILENFDFEKVYNVMKYTNWGWATSEPDEYGKLETKIPSISKLVVTASKLLYEAYEYTEINDENESIVSTGGFEARYFKDVKYFDLKFVLESYNFTEEDEDY